MCIRDSLSALGFGNLLRPLISKHFSNVDRFGILFLGGLGLLGTFLFCVGHFRFSLATILLVMAVGATLLLRSRPLDLLFDQDTLAKPWPPVLPAVLVIAVLILAGVAGLALPTGDIKLDGIAYHLLGPRVWSNEHIIRPVPDECMTAFPAIVETQFAALMQIGGQRAPDLYSLLALLSLLLVTVSLARRLGLSSSGAWWAAAFIMTMPVVHRTAYGGFVDVVYSGFVLTAARIAFDAESSSDFALLGFFWGFAMGTKYFGLPAWLLLMASAFYAYVLQSGKNTAILLKGLTLASVVGLLIAAPWYLRNWIYLGSPIYPPPPLLLTFFHPRYLPPQAMQNFLDFFAKAREGMGRGPLAFFLLPFHFTFHPANFLTGAGGVGLCLLAFAPVSYTHLTLPTICSV